MSNIRSIAEKLAVWMNNIDSNIEDSVNKNEQELTDLNKKQLLMSTGNDDKPLVNQKTGSSYLSKQYARRTGKNRPDLRLKGDYYKEMFTQVISRNEYTQSSFDRKVEFLPDIYPNAHGIAPSNRRNAYSITNHAIGQSIKAATGLT